MGATAMPRTNVIVSLVCRSVLSQHESNGGPSAFGDQQLSPRHGGVLSHTSQTFTATDDMSMDPSAIMIGEYNPQCSFGEIESATAMITLWGNLVASALGAVTAPIWGKMSDRFGRIKPLAAVSTLILASEICVLVVATMPDRLSYQWIYGSFFPGGA